MSNSRHGMSKTRLYHIWTQMIQRCHNTESTGYEKYGAKGIEVTEEWHDPYLFMGWALLNGYRENLTIERKDGRLGYSPDNCTWIPCEQQAFNQGKSSRNTSGYVGVSFHKGTGKWAARVTVAGKRKQIGRYDTPEEANQVRLGYFEKHGLEEHLKLHERQHSSY